MSAFRSAHVPDYAVWLRAWLERGGKPTHYYEYPMSQATWLVAEQDFSTGGECGADSVNIIVPTGVQHTGGDLGHNGLFFVDGPDLRGSVVPIYSDPEFASLSGIPEFIAEKREEHRRWQREQEERQRARREARGTSDIGRHFSR